MDPFILGQKKGQFSGANSLLVFSVRATCGVTPEAPGHPFGLSWSGALGTLGRQVVGVHGNGTGEQRR